MKPLTLVDVLFLTQKISTKHRFSHTKTYIEYSNTSSHLIFALLLNLSTSHIKRNRRVIDGVIMKSNTISKQVRKTAHINLHIEYWAVENQARIDTLKHLAQLLLPVLCMNLLIESNTAKSTSKRLQ